MQPTPVFILSFLVALPLAAGAEGLWGSLKDGTSRAVEAGGAAVAKGAEVTGAVVGRAAEVTRDTAIDTAAHFYRDGTPEEVRARVDQMAAKALDRLFGERPDAALLYEQSHGYAVFEARQVSFKVVAGYGYGVAVERPSATSTYMKMAVGGVGLSLGFGGFGYQLVMLFEDEAAFRRFVTEGLDASAEATTMVGENRQDLTTRFVNGVAVFKLTDAGFKVAASLAGSRFWPDRGLDGAAAPASAAPDAMPH